MCFHDKNTWTCYIVAVLLSCALLYDVRVCVCIYLPCFLLLLLCGLLHCMYLYIPAMFSAASLWVATLLLLPLLFVIVYRMAKFVVWFIASDSSVFFLSIQTQCTFNARTPSQYCRICSLDLPIANDTYHNPHVITGMRGVKAGDIYIYKKKIYAYLLVMSSQQSRSQV